MHVKTVCPEQGPDGSQHGPQKSHICNWDSCRALSGLEQAGAWLDAFLKIHVRRASADPMPTAGLTPKSAHREMCAVQRYVQGVSADQSTGREARRVVCKGAGRCRARVQGATSGREGERKVTQVT